MPCSSKRPTLSFSCEREKIQSKKSGLFTLKSKIRRRRMADKSLVYKPTIRKAATHKKHVVKTRERGKERERERERESKDVRVFVYDDEKDEEEEEEDDY